ncbi:hypothetical protein WMF31_31475 [Sorangium sp. So ce1036]|uniref:hypothetical protein n=1 Tax=Sorangium sp. So ce1036 TaxID=3133328 RepID=UPI003F02EDD3
MTAGSPLDGSWGAMGYTGVLGYTFSETQSGGQGAPDGLSSRTHAAWVSPSVEVFVTDRFSVGGTIGFSYTSHAFRLPDTGGAATRIEGDSFAISVVPRVGYAISLGEPLALWPRAGFGYSASQADSTSTQGVSSSMSAWIGVVDLGLVYRPTEHIYLHMAPELVLRISSIQGSRGVTLQRRDPPAERLARARHDRRGWRPPWLLIRKCSSRR